MSFIKKTKKWIGFNFDSNRTFENPPREGTDSSDKAKQFFRDLRSDLKKSLAEIGLKIYQMRPNYYDINLIISNETEDKFIYVMFGDIRWDNWYDHITIRTMKHPKDWIGGANHSTNAERLINEIQFLYSRM